MKMYQMKSIKSLFKRPRDEKCINKEIDEQIKLIEKYKRKLYRNLNELHKIQLINSKMRDLELEL